MMYVRLVVLAVMLAGGYGLYHFIGENAVLKEVNKGYEDSITGYKIAVESVMEGYIKNEDEKSELENKLASHDLGLLAKSKPKMVERRINAGTVKLFKSIETASRDAIDSEAKSDKDKAR